MMTAASFCLFVVFLVGGERRSQVARYFRESGWYIIRLSSWLSNDKNLPFRILRLLSAIRYFSTHLSMLSKTHWWAWNTAIRIYNKQLNLVSWGRDFFWSTKQNRDIWEKSEGEPASAAAATLSAHVQKLLLNSTASIQSNWNQDFLVPVFDFPPSVGRSASLIETADP